MQYILYTYCELVVLRKRLPIPTGINTHTIIIIDIEKFPTYLYNFTSLLSLVRIFIMINQAISVANGKHKMKIKLGEIKVICRAHMMIHLTLKYSS